MKKKSILPGYVGPWVIDGRYRSSGNGRCGDYPSLRVEEKKNNRNKCFPDGDVHILPMLVLTTTEASRWLVTPKAMKTNIFPSLNRGVIKA